MKKKKGGCLSVILSILTMLAALYGVYSYLSRKAFLYNEEHHMN